MISKTLKAILIFAALGYACVVGYMYTVQRDMLFPGASSVTSPPSGSAPWGDPVVITTPDGETLAALRTTAREGKATVLFFEGNADDIAGYGFLAEALAKAGYGLLAVAYRGYPGSTGTPTEDGLLLDGLAAFDWLAAQQTGPIAVMGRSLGSGVAVNTAAERDAEALVLISAYDSTLAIASSRYPYLPVSWLMTDTFRSDLRIAKFRGPKLFLHGDLDNVIPLQSGQKLFSVAGEPKTFIVEQGKGHHDIWSWELLGSVVDFLDKIAVPAN